MASDLNEINLDEETGTSGNLSVLPPTQTINILVFQEQVRSRIATILVGSLLFTIICIWVYIASHSDEDKNIQLINLIWTSLVTLIGAVFGFYFASKNQ